MASGHLTCNASCTVTVPLSQIPLDMAEEVEKAAKKVRDDRLAEQERRQLVQRGSRDAKMKTQLDLATKRAKKVGNF